MWRKTRSRQVSNLCIGVDPNRNFGYNWAGKVATKCSAIVNKFINNCIGEGTSSIPCSEIYHGPSAFSEPETRAIRDLISSKGRRVKAFFDIHSYSQYWLIPWGFTKDSPDDYHDMVMLHVPWFSHLNPIIFSVPIGLGGSKSVDASPRNEIQSWPDHFAVMWVRLIAEAKEFNVFTV